MTTSTPSERAIFVDDDGPQKLVYVTSEDTPGIQPGIAVLAATTREKGLEYSLVDLREFIPGITASAEAGTRLVTDVPSFLAELDRYPIGVENNGYGTLWGDETKGTVVAVYNDHHLDGAGLRDNRLALELRPDSDWVAWHRLSGKYLAQEEFGDAIEELLHTIIAPDQAELLEVIDSIRATSKGHFESRISRADGAQQIEFSEEVSSTAGRNGQLEVPKTIAIAIRPWEGLEPREVQAWFRLRVVNGSLLLAVKLKPTRQILREAWSDVVAQIENHLDGKPVLASRF